MGSFEFIFLILFVLTLCSSVSSEYIYCEPQNCYDVLGVSQDASQKEIRSQYRKLSRLYHPDMNKDPEAVKNFRALADANEILSDPEERKEYDYYLEHPEEAFYNKMRYYRRRYAPKSDPVRVVASFLIFLSVLQYALQYSMYQNALKSFMKYDKKFLQKVKAMALEEQQRGSQSASSKGKKRKKDTKEDLAGIEERIKNDLSKDIHIEGGYKKPEFADLLICRMFLLPVTVYNYAKWQYEWYHKHTVLGEPLSHDEKLYLAAKAYGTSVDALQHNNEPEELLEMLDREVWIPENKKKYDNHYLKRKYPNKYKQMLRYKKQHDE